MTSASEGGTAPGYGIVERGGADNAIALAAERIRLSGYAVVHGGFSTAEIADLGARLDRVMERQVEEFGGADRLAAIGDTLTARCPLLYDDAFVTLAAHAAVLALCRELLGDYIILMQQNGVINPAGQRHTQLAYHRDLPYQHFVSSRPLAISALFCIDPFRAETGATTLIPASHRMEAFPSAAVAADLDTVVTAEPGSFIVFDSMIFHRAGENRSDRPRRAVNHVFSVPIIAQQISLPDALQGKHAGDPALARLLGYDVAPAPSVAAWRERRLARRR
ncbi:MAG TPA: phytanoyl-CoA dioxygenase family protein [Vicinamibacterales bacterium]|nr:phytanoyl-CoA dioxygenase family protein [Vicinamibacterales bacterium]